jgi:hypothetical protein
VTSCVQEIFDEIRSFQVKGLWWKTNDHCTTLWARVRTKFAIVAANNHYAGFGPATVNSFRKMVGLREAIQEEMKQKGYDNVVYLQ